MNDSLLRKYSAVSPVEAALASDDDAVDDLGCFGWLRGVRERAFTLELRKKTGNVLAIGYHWIERMDFDPSEGIILQALGQKIRIRGRNLNAEMNLQMGLFAGLCRHRVPWIREVDRPSSLQISHADIVVDLLEW